MEDPVYVVYPDRSDWVVRRLGASSGVIVRLSTREAALLSARKLADESIPGRILVVTARGLVGLNYDV
jgi:hypothetical protein